MARQRDPGGGPTPRQAYVAVLLASLLPALAFVLSGLPGPGLV